MGQDISIKVGVERCLDCGHKWIDYSNSRECCYMCGRKNYSDTLSLENIKKAISSLRSEKNYIDKNTKRVAVLKQRYRETADLYMARAKDIYGKIQPLYEKGDVSDRMVDQLIMCFRLFSEVGLNKSAASCAYMIATAYTNRGVEKEVQSIDDLADLIVARQWFLRLEAKEWEGAINLHIGEKAMATIGTDPVLLQTMMQIGLWHFYRARNYYYDRNMPQLVERIQFDIDQTTKLLSSYTRGLSEIEAAKISAAGNENQGNEIRKGLEALGVSINFGLESFGEQIERFGGSLNRALKGTAGLISASMSYSAYALSSATGRPNKILKDGIIDIGKMINTSVHALPEAYSKPVNDLGNKVAKSTANKGIIRKVISDEKFQQLRNMVMPETEDALKSLIELEQPSEKTPDSLMDTLVTEGMDSVLEQIKHRRPHN